MVDIVMHGDQVDKMTQSCHPSSLSERSVGGVPVVGPIWRGGIEIVGSFNRKLDGLEVFMPKNLHPKDVKLEQSLQKSTCFCMKSRHALWPKHFDDVGATHSNIDLFMFPEVSRSEIDYDDLLEQMISNDLAMTSHIGNFELIIFTSLEQEDNQQHIQGKYYLWGILKGKGYMRCKSSKGKNTNAQKKRISKSISALDWAKKSNSPLSGRSVLSVGHQLFTTTQSAVRYDFVPPLSQGCKRTRSKRGRISRMLKEEAGDVHKSVVADFSGSPLPDFPEEVIINTETQEAEQRSWDSTMEIVEPSDSSAINVKETEVEHRTWDSDMEIDEPTDDVVKARVVTDSSCVFGPTVAVLMVTTNSNNHSCLIPFLHDKEGLDVHETDPPIPGETNACLDEKSLVDPSNSVADDHKWTELQDTMPGISEISVGLCQLVARVDQECQASEPLLEMDSCRTPVFEEPGPCSSSNSTLVLELNEEDDEEETAIKGTEIFNEGSGMITTTSMLNIADIVPETSSDTLRVQVGRYTIKSDLAPILRKILMEYGDIALGCSMMPEIVLEEICKVFKDLEQVSFKGLRSDHLDSLRNLCQVGEALKIDMKWLYDRCDDLEKTVLQLSQYPRLQEELAQCSESIKSLEENLDLNRSILVKLLEENKLMEEEIESLTELREKLQLEIEHVRFESRRFIGKSLVDGLF